MRTIYKYPIDIKSEQLIEVPAGAEPICVQKQREQIVIWALVEDDQPTRQQTVLVRGTGANCADIRAEHHLGTVQLSDGHLVFHVFWPPPSPWNPPDNGVC